jgi:pilus assembly protein CpaB
MNFRRLGIAMTIGLLISGACTYLLSRKIAAQPASHSVQLTYVAAAAALRPGAILKAEDVEIVPWPAATPIADAFSKPDRILGRAVLYPIGKGQPITDSFLASAGSGNGLAGKIPDGMRAIALRSDEIVGVAGFLMPDSHVDVLATIHSDRSPEPKTFIVLQDARVLAAGHQMEPDPEGKAASVNVVTLLLTPADAERAVLASQQGTIHFILRSGSDQGTEHADPLSLAQLVGSPDKPADPVPVRKAPAVVVPPPPPTIAVETIAGDKLTTETFPTGAR